MCPLHSYLLLAVVPPLRCPIFPLHILFGPRQSPLLVPTFSALLIVVWHRPHTSLPLHPTSPALLLLTFWYLPLVPSNPPLSSVWPRRFLLPRLPSSPPLAAHSPLRPVFICISIPFSFSSIVLPFFSSTHPPIHCPLPLRPRQLHASPSHLEHAVALPSSPHTRARRTSCLAAYFHCRSPSFMSHPSTLYPHSHSLSPLALARPPTRPFPRFHPF
ncbi:hypothetical protein DFH09DRAFT_1320612 [Mycena vulgaris]|nr:hypothetical protein DFH09DRAFT_1320612 [Mycena vulgaris]